ncbi:MAG: dicarboxylate/amino acid:cation symporter [Pseudomonadota bacterium]
MKLWVRVLIGLIAGILLGIVLGPDAAFVKPIGDIFIRLIKMLMVPLIFLSLVTGVTSMGDTARMGTIGIKTIAVYLVTTTVAVTLGLVFATLFKPGVGVDTAGMSSDVAKPEGTISAVDLFVNIVPINPVEAMADGNVLQVIFFALLIGVALVAMGDKVDGLKRAFDQGAELMYKVTYWVMETAPFGVFALIAWAVGTKGAQVIESFGWLTITLYLACLCHILIVSFVFVKGYARLPIKRFFGGIRDAQLVSFSTATSSGTLPVTLSCMQENLGVSRSVSSFVLPIGATMNMDGTAIYMGIVALFTAQAFGVDLSFGAYLTIILTGTLASIGAAGIPSAGLILIPVVLASVGLPDGIVALIFPIDRLLDMMRTATNVTGDCVVTTVVAKTENEIDEDVFRSPATV